MKCAVCQSPTCKSATRGNLSGGQLVAGLTDGTLFNGLGLDLLSWTDLGKDDAAGDQGGPVTADVGSRQGAW